MRTLSETTLEQRIEAAHEIMRRPSWWSGPGDGEAMLCAVVWPDGIPHVSTAVEWSREGVIHALRRWAIEHGSWPRSSEWQIAAAGVDTTRRDYLTHVPADLSLDFERPEAAETNGKAELAERYVDEFGLEEEQAERLAEAAADLAAEYPATLEEARDALAPPPDPVGENPSLSDVAEVLEAAREQLEQAQAAYDLALHAFKQHPVLVSIAGEESWKLP